MSELRIALFDFDGTLVDSVMSIIRHTQIACEAANVSRPSEAHIRQNIGKGLMDAALDYAAGDEAKAQLIFDGYRASARRELTSPSHQGDALFDGAQTALEALSQEGWLLGIVTNKGRFGLQAHLEMYGMTELFDVTLTADDVPVKPAPDMALEALRRTGVDVGRACLIGDTINDARCAMNAKMDFVGVSWGYHADDVLRGEGACYIAPDFPELVQFLNTHIPK